MGRRSWWLPTTKISRVRRVARFTCVTGGSSTDDRPARAAQSGVSAVAVGDSLVRIRDRCRSDDRAALDWRGDAIPGAQRKAGRWWDDYGIAGRARRRSNEDGRNRRPFLLDRTRRLSLQAGVGVAQIQE